APTEKLPRTACDIRPRPIGSVGEARRFGKLAPKTVRPRLQRDRVATMTKVFAGVLAAVIVSLAAPAHAQAAWDHVARVVVIGDLHGDYGKFHDQLSQAGLINARDAWSGGAAHLVQLGDVPDRAPDTRKILDLLIRLEPQ